jgi:hypothetical protein
VVCSIVSFHGHQFSFPTIGKGFLFNILRQSFPLEPLYQFRSAAYSERGENLSAQLLGGTLAVAERFRYLFVGQIRIGQQLGNPCLRGR